MISSGFPTENLHACPLSPIRATCPAHLVLLILNIQVIFVRRTCYEAPYYTTSSSPFLHRPSWAQMALSAPYFLNTLSLCSFLNVRYQVLQPYNMNRQNYRSLCVSIYIYGKQTRRQYMDLMVVAIPRVRSAFNVFVNAVLIC